MLDADPELGADLDPEAHAAARARIVAPVISVPAGPWDPPEPGRSIALGLLVLDGIAIRDIAVAGRTTTELLAEGDVLRPWDGDMSLGPIELKPSWTVLEPARLAVLDHRFAAAAARWPALTSALLQRAVRRSRWLAVHHSVTHLPRTDARLLLLFWALAERFGTVRPDGVHVPLTLTHETLAKLVGARRPSVTTALRELGERGAVTRLSDGVVLDVDGAAHLRELARPRRNASRNGNAAAARSRGEDLADVAEPASNGSASTPSHSS